MTQQQQIDQYLSDFRSHLRSVTLAEREEIVREISAHIRDSVEEPGSDAASVLARLGSPQELAIEYRDGALIRHASRSFSPVLLLRAALRLATKGLFGILVLFCGLFGYVFGIGFALTGVVKLLAPTHTGLWMHNGQLVASGALVPVPPPPAHEVLGWWYVPLAFGVGAILFSLASVLIRRCLRVSQRWQARLAPSHSGRPHLSPEGSGGPTANSSPA